MSYQTAYRSLQYCLLACFIAGFPRHKAIASEKTIHTHDQTIAETVIGDYKRFYSVPRLTRIGLGFGLGAISANTNIDNEIQNWQQKDLRNSHTDNYAKTAKTFGEVKYLVPLSLLSAGVNYFGTESPLGNWGTYSARAYLVGSPAIVLMQVATGGSRPGETSHESSWRPFNDNNGVSGHAFIGAVPFLTLAKMNNENKLFKYIAYAASTAAAWSRINDNAHYPSQAALGWYMAWESVNAVYEEGNGRNKISTTPIIGQDSYGIAVNIKW